MVNSFIPFPILTTAGLTLRQLSASDSEDIFALRSDPAINKYLDRQPASNIQDAISFINKINDSIKKSNSLYWAITLSKSKTFAGTICLFDFSNENNKCEIGYELLTNYQGQGIMKEAAEKVIDYAFHTIRIQRIEASVHKDNQASQKLLEKLKFKSIEPDKLNQDYSIFALTNTN